MTRNLKQVLFIAIAAIAVSFMATAESQADSFADQAGTWDWTNASAWTGGVPVTGETAQIGGNGGGDVAGVILNVTGSTAAVIGHTNQKSDSHVTIDAGSSITVQDSFANNWHHEGDAVMDVYGDFATNGFYIKGDEWNIYNGGTASGGQFRLAQAATHTPTLNINPGGYFEITGADANTSEGGGIGTANQSGGIAHFMGNLVMYANTGGYWNLTGGEMAVDGTLSVSLGTNGGVNIAGGKLYVAGDQTGDLTHGGSVHNAVSATFGNYVLANSTALNGYTLFEGAAVPEPSSFVLAALGLLGLGWFGVRRRRKA